MPLRKLQEIVVNYAEVMYRDAQRLAAEWSCYYPSCEYPYKGAAFSFHVKDGLLQMKDGTGDLIPGPGSIPSALDHGLYEPDSNGSVRLISNTDFGR